LKKNGFDDDLINL